MDGVLVNDSVFFYFFYMQFSDVLVHFDEKQDNISLPKIATVIQPGLLCGP